MFDKQIKEYKTLSEDFKNDLDIYASLHDIEFFQINDDKVINTILDLSREAWLKDEYSKSSMSSYAGFLAQAYGEGEITLEDLQKCDKWDVIEDFNGGSIEAISSHREEELEK